MRSLKTFSPSIIVLGFFLYAGCAPVHPVTAPPPPPVPQKDIEYFSPPKTVYVKEKSVNIRSGAGTQFDVLTSVKLGTALKVHKREEQWFYVEQANKNMGYIFMPLTSEDKPRIMSQPKPLDDGSGGNESDDQLPPPRKIEPAPTDPPNPNTIGTAEPVDQGAPKPAEPAPENKIGTAEPGTPEPPKPAEPVPENKVENPDTGKSIKPPWVR